MNIAIVHLMRSTNVPEVNRWLNTAILWKSKAVQLLEFKKIV